MFTERTQWHDAPNPLSQAWAARRALGLECFDLTLSNPTQADLSYPRAEILNALARPESLVYEPHPLGALAARAALAHALRPGVDPDRLLLTASTSESYAWVFKLLAERGDDLLVPAPSYPLFDFLARLEEVRLVPYPLQYDARWHIDRAALEAAIGPRTRAILVVHPNNPTGHYVEPTEAAWLLQLAAERGLAVISDEVFLEFPWSTADSGAPVDDVRARGLGTRGLAARTLPVQSLAAGNPAALTFALGGLSKCAGLPQLKLGWIEVAGPDPLAREAMRRLEVLADTYLSVNTPVQRALPILLELRGSIRAEIAERIARNLAFVRSRHGPTSSWDLLRAEAGWYACLRVPDIRTEEEWALALVETEGVLVHPGYFFDFPSGAHLVLGLLSPESDFALAFLRIERSIDTLRSVDPPRSIA